MPLTSVKSLTPEQVESFWTDGFLTLPSFLDDETLQRLRDLYDQFVSGEIEAGEDNVLLGGVTRQIMYPSKYHEYFDDNPAVQAGLTMAGQLASGEPELTFDMLITKPPRHEVDTPWHQDNAYFDMPFAAAGIATNRRRFQFWVALDDVDVDNGCMQFIPGMHMQPLLEHHVASGDPQVPSRLLAITDPDEAIEMSTAVACPLEAGGCTIHAMGTPHFTGGNSTRTGRGAPTSSTSESFRPPARSATSRLPPVSLGEMEWLPRDGPEWPVTERPS